MKKYYHQPNGFTIVELLIVIVVIGILATISVVAYSGVQESARNSKIKSDLRNLENAVSLARTQSSKTLWAITGKVTADDCSRNTSGTDLTMLAKTDACWTQYADSLDKISVASGMNVRNLVDPWGRPYFIYENEGRTSSTDCTKDVLALFERPHVQWAAVNMTYVPNSLSNC